MGLILAQVWCALVLLGAITTMVKLVYDLAEMRVFIGVILFVGITSAAWAMVLEHAGK